MRSSEREEDDGEEERRERGCKGNRVVNTKKSNARLGRLAQIAEQQAPWPN